MVRLSDLVPDFVLAETRFQLSANTATVIAKLDNTRWGLVISTLQGASSIFISTIGDASVNRGVFLTSSNPPIQWNFRDQGALVSGPLYATSAGVGVQLTVIEIFYRPQSGNVGLGQMADALDEVGSP